MADLCGTATLQITPHLDTYPNASLLWCQEEPLNNGAWSYAGPRIYTAASQTVHHKGKYPFYAGREPTSSVATGSKVCIAFVVLRAGLTVRLCVSVPAQEGDRVVHQHRV